MPPRLLRLRIRLADLLERELLTLGVVAFYAVGVAVLLPATLVPDSWLALVSGREVAERGLPSADQLTVWTHGVHWVDQQWLGQLVLYALHGLGGWRLLMVTHLAALVATLAVGAIAARRRGGSPLAVCLVAVVVMFAAPWSLQLRAQSMAALLFALLLWLLVEDSARPARRVLFAIPLLAIWANVHGTVVLGAGLVALRALVLLVEAMRRRSRPVVLRSVVLLAAAPLTTLASPYGFELVGYYRRMLVSPLLREFVVEWRPPAPSGITAVFYVLGFAAVWLLARQHRRLHAFEKLTLLLTLVGGLSAIRNIAWFALAALVLLPTLLEGELSTWRSLIGRRSRLVVASAILATVAATAGRTAARPNAWFTSQWPGAAASAISGADAGQAARVLADDRYADWLLWRLPELRGRLAYDVRFELFSRTQFDRLVDYHDGSTRLADGYQLLVLDLAEPKAKRRLARPGAKLLFRDPQVAVLSAPASSGTRRVEDSTLRAAR